MSAPTNLCPRCGTQFRCGMEAGDMECWCARLPAVLQLPAQADDDPAAAQCFCPSCLKAMPRDRKLATP